MAENLHELLSMASAGRLQEHLVPNVQLKESWKQDAGKQLCGRANDLKFKTSWMVIGVSDNGKPLERDENWIKDQERQVSAHINQYLEPATACSYLQCHQIDKSWVIVIGMLNPGTVVRWGQEAYKSSGTTCLKMLPEEALEFAITLPGLQDPSAQPWQGSIDPSSVQDFARRVASRDGQGALSQIDRLSTDTILDRLWLRNKVASRVLFGDIRCRVVAYDLADNVLVNKQVSLYSILSRDFQDSIPHLASRAHRPDAVIPPLALSEGIANAVAHAAYFERNGEIMIEIHPNLVCISNLCLQSASAFANKWFSRSHQTLNVFLMESMRLAGYVDELGRGKNLIFREFLLAGMSPPSVSVEPAGRVSRWRLLLPTHGGKERYRQLLGRLRERYLNDDKKALLAMALCLWEQKSVSEIKNYVGQEYRQLLQDILDDLDGPVFSGRNDDKVYRVRWTRLILDEGLDSKELSAGEEDRLLKMAHRIQTEFNAAIITPSMLRKLGQMGDTKSEKTLSSKILRRWELAGVVIKVGKGKYKFNNIEQSPI